MAKHVRIAFYTLGCKVNQSETESWQTLFREKGCQIVDFSEKATVYLINTCTVTHLADRKSRQIIRRARKINPGAQIVVTGCYAQTNPEAIKKITGVSLIVGTSEKDRLVDLVMSLLDGEIEEGKGRVPAVFVRQYEKEEGFVPLPVGEDSGGRARAYLKVQEGCAQFCAYCIIPYARGPLRSRPVADTLAAAEDLIKKGYREIVLLGIHLGAYGQEWGSNENLVPLLKKLLPLSKEVRWRLGSLEPMEVSEALIELMAAMPNICPHLHLPLQGGHDQLLKAMRRPYYTEQYREIVTKLRKRLPEMAITTDIMVGFPGETEEYFLASLDFVNEIAFSKIHVFRYSARQGTPAAQFPCQVSSCLRETRSGQMIHLGKRLERQYAEKFMGRFVYVLVEEKNIDGACIGSSDNYLKVKFRAPEAQRGQIMPVYLKGIGQKYCLGDAFSIQ